MAQVAGDAMLPCMFERFEPFCRVFLRIQFLVLITSWEKEALQQAHFIRA